MVRHDLREVKLGIHAAVEQVPDLIGSRTVRIGPPAQCQTGLLLTNQLTKFPGVIHASGRSDLLVASKYNESRESLLRSSIRVRETVFAGMLAREERHYGRTRHVGAEIDHEVTKVVFLSRANRAVRKKHEGAVASQASNRVIRIDPCIHARRRLEFRTRRPEFRRNDSVCRLQGFEERSQSAQYTEGPMQTAPVLPTLPLAPYVTPVEELSRLRRTLGGGPRLLVKRDDALPFAFGGNKVRKMRLVGADALASGADTLITAGGVQSNHARVTAATAATLGMRCVLVVNGTEPAKRTANALLDQLLGAEVRHVATRDERNAVMDQIAEDLRRAGRRPYVIPVGASTPLGAVAFVHAIDELIGQDILPQTIIHATSSGGTQSGLVAGCVARGLATRVIGVSADESSSGLTGTIRGILNGLAPFLEIGVDRIPESAIVVDDRFVGGGYGLATPQSSEALELAARTEALFLDHTYTAKAMAGLIDRVRRHEFGGDETVLFWHTGGQVGLFQ